MPNLQIYRTTTPVLIFKIKNDDFDMSSILICHITLENKNGLNSLTLDNPVIDTENKTVKVRLTQDQTAMFSIGLVRIQMKIKLKNDDVISTKVIEGDIMEILEEELL